MTTIDWLRHPSISEAVTRAAGIDPEPTRSRGVTRWTAQARRAVSPAARPTSWKSARGPGQRGRDREAAEAWDALAIHAGKQASVCRHGAELADRTRRRWAHSV